jgi:pentatricopeptide repeat protein
MMNSGTKHNEITITTLIKGLCQFERIDEAFKILIKNWKIINIRTINTILRLCLQFGKYEITEKILKFMKEKNFIADITSYQYLLKIFSKVSNFEEIEKIIKDMNNYRIFYSISFYDVALSYLFNGDLKKSKQFLNLAENSIKYIKNSNYEDISKNDEKSLSLFLDFKSSEIKNDIIYLKEFLNQNKSFINTFGSFQNSKFIFNEINNKKIKFEKIFDNENKLKMEVNLNLK